MGVPALFVSLRATAKQSQSVAVANVSLCSTRNDKCTINFAEVLIQYHIEAALFVEREIQHKVWVAPRKFPKPKYLVRGKDIQLDFLAVL